MRLNILNTGYPFGTKILFSVIKLFSGYPLPDAARLVFYRPEFYGNPAKQFTQRAMRGPSAWSVAEREAMAAYISGLNQCTFCIKAHTAVANLAGAGEAPSLQLSATLKLLDKLTRQNGLEAGDIQAALDQGVSGEQIRDALAICFAFNVTNRLADAFDFEVPADAAFQAGAKYLLKRGYA